MSGIEIIGFIISILSLLFLFFKNRHDTRYREEHPQEFQKRELMEENDEEEEHVRELMQHLTGQRKERRKPASLPPPPAPRKTERPKIATFSEFDDYHLVSPIETRKIHSPIENRKLKSKLATREITSKLTPLTHHHHDEKELVGPSKARKAISRLSRLPDIVIYTEILSPPKSLRPD